MTLTHALVFDSRLTGRPSAIAPSGSRDANMRFFFSICSSSREGKSKYIPAPIRMST